MSHITLNIVEPGTTPVDPVVPNTGLFTNGIGGPEATIIVSVVLILAIVSIVLTTYIYRKHKKLNKTTKLVHIIDQTKLVINSKKRITVTLATLALLVSAGTFIALVRNSVNASDTEDQTKDKTNLTVNTSDQELTIEVGDEPVFAVLPVEITVEEATKAGYTLTAYTDNTDLVSTTDDSNIIPMISVDEDELVALTEDTYGLSLSKPESRDDETYTTISTDQSNPTTLKTIDGYTPTPAEDKTTIYYGFYITPGTPYGTYTSSDIYYEAEMNTAKVVFNGNGKFYFDGDATATTNIMNYIPGKQSAPQYSHTPNVNDEGIQTEGEMYPLDSNETFVYEFDGMKNVYIDTIKTGNDNGCGPDSNDYFSIWAGPHPNYTAKANWETALSIAGSSGKNIFYDNGVYDDANIDIEGNAVTIAYTTSDYRATYCVESGYGYYAKVIGYNPNIATSGEYEKPTTDGAYRFLGWSEDKDATTPTYKTAADIERALSLTTGETATLYAISEPAVVITYNGNGADSTTNMDNVEQYTTNIETTSQVDLLASNFKKEGYGFVGWSTDTDAWTHLTDDDESNNPTIYGPNQMITVDPSTSTKLALYAVWAPAETDASGSPISLQDWQGCSSLTTTIYNTETGQLTVGKNTITALTDNRDGNIYTVARLADGNCWMTENLRLDNNPELSQQNTNNPSLPLTNNYSEQTTSNKLSASSNSWCTNADDPTCYDQSMLNTDNISSTAISPVFSQDFTNDVHHYDSGSLNANISSYGNYYNWYSATAGNGKYETVTTVAGDICPTGWHLPYGDSQTSEKGGNSNGGFYYLNQQMGGNTSSQGSNNWRSFPNNFIYSGQWYGSSTISRGNIGNYWSFTTNNTYGAYYLSIGGSLTPGTINTGYGKNTGLSARCVAPVQTTITFDGNGSDGGEMSNQAIGATTTRPLNSNEFIKIDHKFSSWNTEKDGSGTSYTNGQNYTTGNESANVTLYAQWEEGYDTFYIVYDGNGADSTTNMNRVEQHTADITSNKQVDLLASNFTKDGYGFVGWSTDIEAWDHLTDNDDSNNPTIYGPNQTITVDPSASGGLKLYAVWAPAETDNNGNPVSLQDWQGCNNLTATNYVGGMFMVGKNTITALTDTRDGEVYTVARLADGNCWMTENLRLDNDATISNVNTNNPITVDGNVAIKNNDGNTSSHLSPSSKSWCTDYPVTPECSDQSYLNINNTAFTTVSPAFTQDFTSNRHEGFSTNIYSYGNYYNWYSATAGNGTYSKETGEVAGDICPAGWQLPRGSNNNTPGSFYYLNQRMGRGDSVSDSNNWRSFPNNFVYSGEKYGSGEYNRGNLGNYWSSTASDSGYVYYLFIDYSYMHPGDSTCYKQGGYSVRCLAPAQ